MVHIPLSDIVTGKVTLTDALKALFALDDRPLPSQEYPSQVDGTAEAVPFVGNLTAEQTAALQALPAIYKDAAEIALRRYITHHASSNPVAVRVEQAPGTVIQFWVQQQEAAA